MTRSTVMPAAVNQAWAQPQNAVAVDLVSSARISV
jgi:hypothetical protein